MKDIVSHIKRQTKLRCPIF